MKTKLNGIVFDSHYFQIWNEHCGLKKKTLEDTICVLKALQGFLMDHGFKECLDFDRFTYFTESNDFEPMDRTCVDSFVKYLVESNPTYSNKTIYNKISYLKNFFCFLEQLNLIKHNPMAHYKNRYYERNININYLSEEECKAVLKEALLTAPFSKYYYLLIWTAITTGLRNKEICNLTFEQINFSNHMVAITKGQKTNARGIAIPQFLAKELQQFKQHKATFENDQSPFVFSQRGRQLSKLQFTTIVRELCESAGIKRRVIPHDLRRTTGFLMLKSGANLRSIQQQLRHELLGTTLEYLSLADCLILEA